jgi:hypothetical protein
MLRQCKYNFPFSGEPGGIYAERKEKPFSCPGFDTAVGGFQRI